MLSVSLNEAVKLRLLAADGASALFARVRLYNASGLLVSSLPMAHVAEGLYEASWTPAVEGLYSAVGQLFLDAGLTVDAGYEHVLEDVEVSTSKAALARLLGLVQENTVIDAQAYDVQGNLTSARIRTYDSKANALAAGAAGLVASYTMTATYTANQLTDYKVVRDA